MPARHLTGWAVTGITSALLLTGCATAVTGSPRAAETPIVVSTQQSDTAATTPTVSPTVSAPPTSTAPSSTATTPPTSTSSSSLRPMPPLDTSGTADPTTSTPTTAAGGGETIAGVDLDAIRSDLSGAYVAGVQSDADLDAIATLVDGARSQGLDLWVVSIGSAIGPFETGDIATALFDTTGGTLLVLSPSLVAVRTDQLTDDARDDGLEAANGAKDDQESVAAFIDAALGGGVDPSESSTSATTTVGKVAGVNIDAVLGALGSDHIALDKKFTGVTAKELSGPVDRAWKGGLELYVVILSGEPDGALVDVCSAVLDQTGGTVLVGTPTEYHVLSEDLADRELKDAVAQADGLASYQEVLDTLVDALLG